MVDKETNEKKNGNVHFQKEYKIWPIKKSAVVKPARQAVVKPETRRVIILFRVRFRNIKENKPTLLICFKKLYEKLKKKLKLTQARLKRDILSEVRRNKLYELIERKRLTNI